MDQPPHSVADYLSVIFLAMAGGLANFLRSNRRARRLALGRLAADLIIAGFAGLLMAYLCQWRGLDPSLTNWLVGVSGYMGTRVLMLFEAGFSARFPKMTDDK